MKKIIIFLVLFFCSSEISCSILTILNKEDDEINIQRPILLSNFSKQQKLYLSYTYEDIYKLKGSKGIIDKLTSNSKKLTLFTPVYKDKNFDISLGYDNYYSNTPLFISSEIEDTKINFDGNGYSAGISIFYKNFGIGLFNAYSDTKGLGTSKQLTDNISLLSKNSVLQIDIDDFKKGIQYGYKNKNTLLAYQENKFNFKIEPVIYDEDDNFTFPIKNIGKSYEFLLRRKVGENKEIQFHSQSGKGDGETDYYYNKRPVLGKNILNSKYKSYSISYITNNQSFSYENYSSTIDGYGIVEAIGMFFGIIGGYHIYDHSKNIEYSKFDYGFKKYKRGITYNFKISVSPMKINYKIHTVQKLFFGIITKEKVNIDEGLKIILIQLNPSITKKIKRDCLLHFDISQSIPIISKREPIISKREEEKIYIEKIEKTKPSGGTLLKISLEYLF